VYSHSGWKDFGQQHTATTDDAILICHAKWSNTDPRKNPCLASKVINYVRCTCQYAKSWSKKYRITNPSIVFIQTLFGRKGSGYSTRPATLV